MYITIPNSVKKIGKNILPYSFLFNKTNLNRIQIPNIVGSFNRRILFGKKYLCSIEIPYSVIFINNSKFNFNSSNFFIIPHTIEVISNYAFYNSNFTTIIIPNSVKKIGKYAFSGCTSFTNITIPNSVKKIGKYAFAGDTYLSNISIPHSVKKIGDRAFMNCFSLPESISIPDSVKKIGREIFLNKSSSYNNGYYGFY